MDQQQFDRRREEDEARQDALLDQIHGGVVGLKNQAHAINDEVVEQNVIIDDIGGRMDDATQDISREEEAARQVNARKKKAVGIRLNATVKSSLPLFSSILVLERVYYTRSYLQLPVSGSYIAAT
uniref:t-SNARE coiled-coil homology domain-containing protein n=1 Tax=Hyaloperonospora arabidopsidis (strain Emoy2) TaxID=559515 RepID=M4BCM7_HYAAE